MVANIWNIEIRLGTSLTLHLIVFSLLLLVYLYLLLFVEKSRARTSLCCDLDLYHGLVLHQKGINLIAPFPLGQNCPRKITDIISLITKLDCRSEFNLADIKDRFLQHTVQLKLHLANAAKEQVFCWFN